MSSELTSLERARRRQGFLALVFVQVFFGLFAVFVKLAGAGGQGFTPRALVSWRIVFAALVLGALALAREGRRALPARADLLRLYLCALLGIVFNQVLAIEGILRTSVVDAGLMMVLIPVFTYALAVLVGQETMRWRRALGIALALAGALVLALAGGRTATAGPERVLGNLLIMLNCASYAGFLVVVRPLLARYSALAVIAWVFVLAATTVPFLLLGEPLLPHAHTPAIWGALAYLLVFSTLLAYLLNTYALARVSASTTAVFIYMQPLVAALGGWLVFHEPPSPAALVAAAFLFVGIWLVTRTPVQRLRAAVEEA